MTNAPVDDVAPVVLASGSPRRRVLLSLAGVAADVISPDIDEIAAAGDLAPADAVVAVAVAKAAAVTNDGRPILAADTMVVCEGEVLGKPIDRADAERILRRQLGRPIEVISGVAVTAPNGTTDTRVATSRLDVDAITDAQLEAYLDTGAGDDKAGALAVQGEAKAFVHLRSGSRSNVYGLPLAETIELLRAAGVAVDASAAVD